jgi:hypothetical protein
MRLWILLAASLIQACDVPVRKPTETGLGDAALDTPNDAGCPRGLVVAATDLSQSANIGLASITGEVLSASIISTASFPAGFTTALGGDIAFPSMPASGDEVVILDRFPRSVVTWVNLATTVVRSQLSVATGFPANPHDYVPVSPRKAYVTRFNSNADPGREPYDTGGDLLIVDPSIPAIMGRVDVAGPLPKSAGFTAHPDRAVLVDGRVYVVLPYYDTAYNSGDSLVAAIDPSSDALVDSVRLTGLSGCSGLDVAPDQDSVAVVCSGRWHGTSTADSSASAIVGLELEPNLKEIWRVSANGVGGRSFGLDVAFVDPKHVLALQLGDLGPPLVNDVAYFVDIETGEAVNVLESANVPVTLSAGPCNHNCGLCFMADAQRKAIHRLTFADAKGWTLFDFVWNDPTGLPPRLLGFF